MSVITIDNIASTLDTANFGYVAVPKPGTQNCAAKPPVSVDLHCWGGIYTADPAKNYWVTSIFTKDGAAEAPFPNDRFERDYSIVGLADKYDPRAVAITAAIKDALGEDTEVDVVLALKDKPVRVLGLVREDGVAQTTEGDVPCKAGQVLVQAPDTSAIWAIDYQTFVDRYQRSEQLNVEPSSLVIGAKA